ncbi:uncharacterized protein LOC144356190 [Saccoglossus kowalevskii]
MMKITFVSVSVYIFICNCNLVNSVSYSGRALPAFKSTPNSRIEDPSEIVSITSPTTREDCAELCLNQKRFLCHSFDYEADTYTCTVLNSPQYPAKLTADTDNNEHWDLARIPVVTIQSSDCQEQEDEIIDLKYQRAALYISTVVFAAVGVVIVAMLGMAIHIITKREVQLRRHFGVSLIDPFLEELNHEKADGPGSETDENALLEEIQQHDSDNLDTPSVEGATGGIGNDAVQDFESVNVPEKVAL